MRRCNRGCPGMNVALMDLKRCLHTETATIGNVNESI
jgi:hypothetical protein